MIYFLITNNKRRISMINWYKGLTPEEIEFYKKMREEQQEAKKKGVKGEIDLILKNVKDNDFDE